MPIAMPGWDCHLWTFMWEKNKLLSSLLLLASQTQFLTDTLLCEVLPWPVYLGTYYKARQGHCGRSHGLNEHVLMSKEWVLMCFKRRVRVTERHVEVGRRTLGLERMEGWGVIGCAWTLSCTLVSSGRGSPSSPPLCFLSQSICQQALETEILLHPPDP